MDGYGEAVCYVINDLTNKELIRRRFQFLAPQLTDEAIPDQKEISDEEPDLLGDEESMILGSRMLTDKDIQFMRPKDLSKLGRLGKGKMFRMLNKDTEGLADSNFIIKEEAVEEDLPLSR